MANLDPSIYNQAGRVNLGAGLSDILNQQRQRDMMNEQRQNSLASLAMQQQAAQKQMEQKGSQDLNMILASRIKSGEPIETVMPWAVEEGSKRGVPLDVTQRHVTNAYSAATPQARSDVAFTQAYPDLVAKQRAEQMFAQPKVERTRTVPVIGPNGQPILVREEEAVGMQPYTPKKVAQERPVNWSTVQTDQGIIQVNPQTGEIRDLGVKAPPKAVKGQMTPEQKTQAEITAQATLNQLTKLYEHPGRTSATGASSFMSMIPATDAKSFASELGTFQAKAFLDAVQAMKGLGALTEAEGQRLVASIGALDPSMKEEDFAANLQSVAGEIYSKAKAAGLNVELPSFAANAKQSAQPAASFEGDKEARYQAWKASQGAK